MIGDVTEPLPASCDVVSPAGASSVQGALVSGRRAAQAVLAAV
jgi:hypothetical protein